MLIYVKSKRSKHTLSFDTFIIRKKKICQFEGMKLDHRNYPWTSTRIPVFEGFRPCKTRTNLLSYYEINQVSL